MKKLLIEALSCEHCVTRIAAELDKLDVEFTIDLATKTVSLVACQECLSKVKTALLDSGYDAVELSDE